MQKSMREITQRLLLSYHLRHAAIFAAIFSGNYDAIHRACVCVCVSVWECVHLQHFRFFAEPSGMCHVHRLLKCNGALQRNHAGVHWPSLCIKSFCFLLHFRYLLCEPAPRQQGSPLPPSQQATSANHPRCTIDWAGCPFRIRVCGVQKILLVLLLVWSGSPSLSESSSSLHAPTQHLLPQLLQPLCFHPTAPAPALLLLCSLFWSKFITQQKCFLFLNK